MRVSIQGTILVPGESKTYRTDGQQRAACETIRKNENNSLASRAKRFTSVTTFFQTNCPNLFLRPIQSDSSDCPERESHDKQCTLRFSPFLPACNYLAFVQASLSCLLQTRDFTHRRVYFLVAAFNRYGTNWTTCPTRCIFARPVYPRVYPRSTPTTRSRGVLLGGFTEPAGYQLCSYLHIRAEKCLTSFRDFSTSRV